eukprot:gnl/Hemi2/4042_TR1411_c0_g1_i1.p1 gnl/Hemi2/4042_TR1411_c0_g1~~gnl/Hemi2/4042_TR1411_c0_g1_i1.p1  ORF type:complete len:359 (+),score=83.34 gnl/Hemi2/4042_TR1411_c0_g1_i1:158-1234(+)
MAASVSSASTPGLPERRPSTSDVSASSKQPHFLARTASGSSNASTSSVESRMSYADLLSTNVAVSDELSPYDTAFEAPDLYDFGKTADKLSFMVGVVDLVFTAFCLGMFTEYFFYIHTVKACILIPLRVYLYRKQNWHYFCFDFCYYTNVLILLYVWGFYNSSQLFKILFSFSCGPLTFAIITFRNSLVFHSLDKITSCFIHISPPVLCWTLRWASRLSQHPNTSFTVCGDAECSSSFFDMTILPLLPYFIWQLMYYLKVVVLGREKIKERKYQTSLTYLAEQKNIIASVINCKGPEWQPVVFMIVQFGFTFATMIPAKLYYDSFFFHSAYLCVMMLVCVWNGAGFYFEVFNKQRTAE